MLAATLLALFCVHTFFWLYRQRVLGHDQVSYLFEAKRYLAGAELYGPRLSETNPPWIIWFSTLPVTAAKLLHLDATTAFHLAMGLLVAISVCWSAGIVRRWNRSGGMATMLLCAAAVVAVEIPERVLLYGQRENLFLVFAIPCLIAVATGVVERLRGYERVLLGISAGIAVCFKPQQLLVIAALGLGRLVVTRSWRSLATPEFVGALLTGAAYLCAIRLWAPLYLRQTLPLLVNTYWALGSYSAAELMRHQLAGIGAAVAIGAAAMVWLRERTERDTILVLVFCYIGALAAFSVQHTGWGYQLYPSVALLAIALSFLLILLIRPLLMRLAAPAHRLASVALLLPLAALTVVESRVPRGPELPGDGDVFAGMHAGDTVYIFSTQVEMLTMASTRDLEWGSRFAHLWMLPALTRNEDASQPTGGAPFKRLSPDVLASLSALQRTQTAEDLDYWKPSLVLVQPCPCAFITQKDFHFVQWFLREPAFAAAWSHYQQRPAIDGFDTYVRRPGE